MKHKTRKDWILLIASAWIAFMVTVMVLGAIREANGEDHCFPFQLLEYNQNKEPVCATLESIKDED